MAIIPGRLIPSLFYRIAINDVRGFPDLDAAAAVQDEARKQGVVRASDAAVAPVLVGEQDAAVVVAPDAVAAWGAVEALAAAEVQAVAAA